jgi:single-stranded DNA-binding protein
MNISIISGRISKEINVKGKTGYFTLANDRDYPFNKDQNGNKVSNFLTCKVIGEKNVERAEKWLKKGTAIIVTGHIFKDTWRDNQGQNQEFSYILVEKWEFQIGKLSEEQSASDSEATESGQSTSQEQTSEPPKAPDDSFMDVGDEILDSLPFR